MSAAAPLVGADAEAFAYSEWLDAQGLMRTPRPDDKRTHEDLVREWRAQR